MFSYIFTKPQSAFSFIFPLLLYQSLRYGNTVYIVGKAQIIQVITGESACEHFACQGKTELGFSLPCGHAHYFSTD